MVGDLFTDHLFDLAPTGLMIVDQAARVTRVNDAMLAVIEDLATIDGAARPSPRRRSRASPGVALPPALREAVGHVLATGAQVADLEFPPPVSEEGLGEGGPDRPPSAVVAAGRSWRLSCHPLRDRDGHLAAVGVAAIETTEQRRAEAARDRALGRLRLLSRAGELVGASLDLTTTLRGMVKLIVPDFADNCELYLAEQPLDAAAPPSQLALRPAVTANTPMLPPKGAGPDPADITYLDQGNPAHRAITLRRPILFDVDERVIASVHQPRLAEHFAYIAVRTAIAVPLLVGDAYYGTVYLGLGMSGRSYSDYDVETAGELGARIAHALANAQAFDHERRTAITLQRGLLPGGLPAVEGLDVEFRYEPGTAGTEVGGDWFDVVPLSAGRVALVIGDVMGRGLTAAAVMGQVRAGLRAFAALDLPAADVLAHLDNLVGNLSAGPEAALVSCVYAIFEPATSSVTVANAGHLAPVLVSPGGQTRLLDEPEGIILGVGGGRFTEVRYPFPDGSALALYTDGLVESPKIDIGQGVERLLASLSSPGPPARTSLPATADRLLTLIDRAGGYDDDVTLLLVRASASPTTRSTTVEPDPRAARAAREVTGDALRQWGLDDRADLVELLVSELVTNAIRYAGTPSDLTLRRGDHALYVEVADRDSRVPRLLDPSADDEGGRGLQLVAELATRWGARPTSTGKTVWFELDTDPGLALV